VNRSRVPRGVPAPTGAALSGPALTGSAVTGLGLTGLAILLGTAAGLALERRLVTTRIRRRSAAEGECGAPFFSLRSPGPDVRTPDGVVLHTEVDEVPDQPDDLTVVLVHGYALGLDCWHFQRAHLRGRIRTVLYDQRSLGRSTRSDPDRCRIPQLADDLAQVLAEVVGPGPVVLVGHSMGGMTIMRLAQTRPELFGERVRGVALFSTAAGEISQYSPVPGLSGSAFTQLVPPLLAALNRLPALVDRSRGSGSDLAHLVTRRLAFGSDVPVDHVEFMSDMLAETSLQAVADYYPAFDEVDEYRALEVLRSVPTAVVGGEDDLVTPLDHTNRIAEQLPEADVRRLPHCGHMGMIEHHDVFNSVLDDLVGRIRGTNQTL